MFSAGSSSRGIFFTPSMAERPRKRHCLRHSHSLSPLQSSFAASGKGTGGNFWFSLRCMTKSCAPIAESDPVALSPTRAPTALAYSTALLSTVRSGRGHESGIILDGPYSKRQRGGGKPRCDFETISDHPFCPLHFKTDDKG